MIQCFVKNTRKDISALKLSLLYICKTDKTYSVLPRVMHCHNDRLEIMLICEGVGLYTIGENRYSVGPGDILIYNSGIIHDEVTNPTSKIKSYCIGIDQLQMNGFASNCLISDDTCPVIKASDHFTLIYSIFATIYEEIHNETDGGEVLCHYLTQSLVQLLLQKSKQEIPVKLVNEQKLGERMKKYIDQNYNSKITLASIAEALNISPDYMSHTFKKVTGYAPIQYMMRRRIGEAQTLLITTKYSITMVATMVGYDNSSYFNKIFHKNIGMSPKRYRECYTQKE